MMNLSTLRDSDGGIEVKLHDTQALLVERELLPVVMTGTKVIPLQENRLEDGHKNLQSGFRRKRN
jgi:hypothetical protein